jgi:hypothetical protein
LDSSESCPGAAAAAAAIILASAQPKTIRGRKEEGFGQCSELLLYLQKPQKTTKGKGNPN